VKSVRVGRMMEATLVPIFLVSVRRVSRIYVQLLLGSVGLNAGLMKHGDVPSGSSFIQVRVVSSGFDRRLILKETRCSMANNGESGKKSATHRKAVVVPMTVQGSSPGIPSQAEYERRELARAHKKLGEIQRAPLADRKEAQASFLKAMRSTPELVGERIGWLFDGNYGMGSMMLARRVLASPRMNRAAALTQMIGAFEWQSPEVMSREAWKTLTAREKGCLDSAVQEAITTVLGEE